MQLTKEARRAQQLALRQHSVNTLDSFTLLNSLEELYVMMSMLPVPGLQGAVQLPVRYKLDLSALQLA